MDYRADQVFASAANVARKGWKIVRLYSVRDNLTCTCHKGRECGNPGKHPSGGNDWPAKATDDENEISEWFDYGDTNENMRVNVGVLLGKASGVIDVEFDTPEGEAVVKRFGLDQIDTPTYRASRGCHRIFRYEDDLPDVGTVKVDGLEVRIGGGGKAAQSVLPCSWHRTAIQYSWLPGRSLDDIDPAPLPPEFKAAVKAASKAGGSGAICQAIDVVRDNRQVTAGGRHGFLVGYASRMARTLTDFVDADRHEVRNVLWALNKVFCSPPKDDDEVYRIADDQFDHYRDKAAERRARVNRPLEQYGLRWDAQLREYETGTWRLTIVHSDPIEYRLRFPLDGRLIAVSIDARQYAEPRDVAGLILSATGRVNVRNPHNSRWVETWNGYTVENDDETRDVKGLSAKLLEEADEEWPGHDAQTWSQHAAFLISYLRPFSRSDDDDDALPCQDGTPRWIKESDGSWILTFKWNELCAASWRGAKAGIPTLKEKQRLKRMILEEAKLGKDFVDRKFVVNGKSGRWIIWNDEHMQALDRLVGA